MHYTPSNSQADPGPALVSSLIMKSNFTHPVGANNYTCVKRWCFADSGQVKRLLTPSHLLQLFSFTEIFPPSPQAANITTCVFAPQHKVIDLSTVGAKNHCDTDKVWHPQLYR